MKNEIFLIRRNNVKNFFITYVFCNLSKVQISSVQIFRVRMNVVAFIYISSRLRKNSHECVFI